MGTTIVIILLSIAIIQIGYGWLARSLQKRMNALEQVLLAHIEMDTQMMKMNHLIRVITEEQRKEQSNEAVTSD